jgi:predicted AAA+ superfamily ATPase
LYRGFFPPIHDRDLPPTLWYDSYVRTYLERDVRLMGGVGDLDAFLRFLRLCAGRTGQILNVSALGGDAGVSHATAGSWLSILRASYVLDLLPPHFENFSKRLVKSPKLHFLDTGLACYLLGVRNADDLRTHPLRGPLVESFVVAELRKVFRHHGETPPLYYWRDSHGREIDVLVDLGQRRVPLEVKAGATLSADFFTGLDQYRQLSGCGPGMLVYGGDEGYERQGHRVRAWWGVA